MFVYNIKVLTSYNQEVCVTIRETEGGLDKHLNKY